MQHRVNAYYLSAGPGREFSLARGNLEMLINIALDRFLKSDASREYWSRIAPEHVKAFEEGNDPKRAISKEFRAHAKNFSNYVLEEPLRSLV